MALVPWEDTRKSGHEEEWTSHGLSRALTVLLEMPMRYFLKRYISRFWGKLGWRWEVHFELGRVVLACYPGTQEAEADEPRFLGCIVKETLSERKRDREGVGERKERKNDQCVQHKLQTLCVAGKRQADSAESR